MIKQTLHQQIVKHYDKIQDWFQKEKESCVFPFYSSFDLRDSSQKVTPVDANLFPAGFNNICEIDRENAVTACAYYLKQYFPNKKNLILLTEEHTHNPYYWDNIFTLKTLLKNSGVESVSVCVPGKNIKKTLSIESAKGEIIQVFQLKDKIDNSDLIINNNDFSVDYNLKVSIPVIPSMTLGWTKRKKHFFFDEYNKLANQFAKLIQVDPDILTIKTRRFSHFDLNNPESIRNLEKAAETLLEELELTYKKFNQKPFLFLKNNSGTYGLGVTTIHSAKDIQNWNYKARKQIKTSKGGEKVTEIIIQEGIASHLKTNGSVAEPVIYFIGSDLIGGFLRTHKNKDITDNLNSPGAIYRTLCISDLEIEVENKPMENVYGWIAYLSVLALAREIQSIVLIPK